MRHIPQDRSRLARGTALHCMESRVEDACKRTVMLAAADVHIRVPCTVSASHSGPMGTHSFLESCTRTDSQQLNVCTRALTRAHLATSLHCTHAQARSRLARQQDSTFATAQVRATVRYVRRCSGSFALYELRRQLPARRIAEVLARLKLCKSCRR